MGVVERIPRVLFGGEMESSGGEGREGGVKERVGLRAGE